LLNNIHLFRRKVSATASLQVDGLGLSHPTPFFSISCLEKHCRITHRSCSPYVPYFSPR
jgi:hypothetical protein